MFPPGRARLVTSPSPTGSGFAIKTMGMVLLALSAARIACKLPYTTKTSILELASSAANSWSRLSALGVALDHHDVRPFRITELSKSATQSCPPALSKSAEYGDRKPT